MQTIKKSNWVTKIVNGTTGKEQFKTWDIHARNGDVFTVDQTDKGFFWMDFNKEQFIGKTEQQAVKFLNNLVG